MYLARFDADGGGWIQGVAALPCAPHPSVRPAWWEEVERVLRMALLLEGITVARRISLDEDGRLRQLVMLLGGLEREDDIRRLLGGLTRLETVMEGSVALPREREEHDRWTSDVPALRWSTLAESFAAGGISLGLDFRMQPSLAGILEMARRLGGRFVYQAILRSAEPDAEASRVARRAVLALERLPGAGGGLLEWQGRLARAPLHSHALVEEVVAVADPEVASAVGAIIRDAYRARYGSVAAIDPEVSFTEGSWEEALLVGVHIHDLRPLDGLELGGACVDAEERDLLIRWRPETLPPDSFAVEAEADAPGSTVPLPSNLPEPSSAGRYLFISYKREDLPRIAPVLRRLVAEGVRVWYDRGIPGGAEWDAVIEERLAGCELVLLFGSSAAMRSKYVRREVKFADAIDRPILCVMLEEPEMVAGMRMLLTQYQMLDARAPDFQHRLISSLRQLSAVSQTVPSG